MHRRLQIRKQAPQSKLRKLRPKGLLRLLCAGVAENANQPTFYVEPNQLYACIPKCRLKVIILGCIQQKKRSEIASLSVGAEGVEPPTLCL